MSVDELPPELPEIILASGSPHRAELLKRLGLPFRQIPPDVDEAPLKTPGRDPLAIARDLARLKALAVAERFPRALVIGSDQVAALDGRILSKPGTPERAIEQLRALSGRVHHLHTAMVVALDAGARLVERVETARLEVRELSDAAIARYVRRDRPLDCAGAYKIESAGVALFRAVRADDFTAIVGLPLLALVDVLAELGFPVP